MAQDKLQFAAQDFSGAPGNCTINFPSGKAAIASGAQACTVTCSEVTLNSVVLLMPITVDATAPLMKVTVAAGSFLVNSTNTAGALTNSTAANKFGFVVVNQ